MSHHGDKKHKKLLQIFKNRHIQHINQQAAVHERNRELDREREEEMREAALASSRSADKPGMATKAGNRQLDVIREKNSHRQRVTQERWNRFAGTSAGGGRGL